jgi:membrane protein YqaA with SNARE-associated domain
VNRLRARLGRFANAPHLVLATSAVLGLPPFSIMATAAGVLAIRVRAFCAIVLAGRAVRFAILIAIAAAAR